MFKSRALRAFTLLELVVAIVILGVLAALAIPSFQTVISNSKTATANNSGLAVARNAVAIAASTPSTSVTTGNLTSAVAEATGVTTSNVVQASGYITFTATVNGAASGTICMPTSNTSGTPKVASSC